LLPTLAQLAGAELPSAELAGKDISDLMTDQPGAKPPRQTLFFVYRGSAQSVRSGEWKDLKEMRFTTMGAIKAKQHSTT